MKKKLIVFFTLLNFCVTPFYTLNLKAAENTDIKVEASSALLMEPKTGTIIFEKNSHEKLPPASVTKIMTMLLTMESVDSGKIKLSDKVTISETAKKMGGSTMLLDTGEVRTVEELIKGIAIASGNDAAVAMAEYISGSEESFVTLMNKRAKELNMNDTVFLNCTGLPATGHVTSAYDISIMSRELLKHPNILKYTGTYMETISEGRKTPIGLVNHNKLVRFFKGCDGLKTGFTDDAKYCISATATRDDVRMLVVIMGAPTYKVRNKDASALLNYGFSKFECKKLVIKGDNIEDIYSSNGKKILYKIKSLEDFSTLVPKGEKIDVTYKCQLNKNMKQYKKGEKIGYCDIYSKGEKIGTIAICTDRDVKKYNIFKSFKKGLNDLFNYSI